MRTNVVLPILLMIVASATCQGFGNRDDDWQDNRRSDSLRGYRYNYPDEYTRDGLIEHDENDEDDEDEFGSVRQLVHFSPRMGDFPHETDDDIDDEEDESDDEDNNLTAELYRQRW